LRSIFQPRSSTQRTTGETRFGALVDAITTLCSPQFAPSVARDCCTAVLLLTRQRRERDRHWAALPCRLRLASSPPNVVLSFFPCIPKTAAAYFLHALYRRPTSSRSHSDHNGCTYTRRRHLFTLEGHLRRPPSIAQHPAARPKLTHCHQTRTQERAQKEERR
jgi:hypothetical protein